MSISSHISAREPDFLSLKKQIREFLRMKYNYFLFIHGLQKKYLSAEKGVSLIDIKSEMFSVFPNIYSDVFTQIKV